MALARLKSNFSKSVCFAGHTSAGIAGCRRSSGPNCHETEWHDHRRTPGMEACSRKLRPPECRACGATIRLPASLLACGSGRNKPRRDIAHVVEPLLRAFHGWVDLG